MSHLVSLISQKDYESLSLSGAVRRAIQLAGFDISSSSGKKVLLKPNMLGAYPPEKGVTTRPEFVKAVARIFIDAGAAVSIGDSPNGYYPLDSTWKVTGMSDVCLATGAKEQRFEMEGSVDRGGFMISRAVLDADIIVNLPKFKTHGLTIMTLAAKNLYGCVCGVQKTKLHRKYPDKTSFAEMIVRVADIVKPSLTLIDGIVAMKGGGPSAGDLVNLGVIVCGTNMHAVDAVCCSLIGLPPAELDTLIKAKELGLWNDKDEIVLAGDPIESLKPAHFALPVTYTKGLRDWWITRAVTGRIWANLSVEPIVAKKRCKRCGMCVKACPVAAISGGDPETAALIDKKLCIQCHCCHEICLHRAIDLKESWLLKVMQRCRHGD